MLKIRRFCSSIIQIIALLCVVLALSACDPPPPEYIKSGDYFRVDLTSQLLGNYEVNFSSENSPTVNISYSISDGTDKTAVFQLDGYDAEKNIGYKLVLQKDKEGWDESRTEGNEDAPDMNDAALIQQAAAEYKFPVVFMWAYQYQNQLSQYQVNKNINKFDDDLKALMKTPALAKWAYDGLYGGAWIKEGIEKAAAYSFDTHFSHADLPVADITYGENKHAVFQLDGYDPIKQVGYKFVTAEDEQSWSKQRSEGKLEVPDLTDSELIRQSALEYRFTIVFIYVPEYWDSTVKKIVDQEFYPAMWGPNINKDLHS